MKKLSPKIAVAIIIVAMLGVVGLLIYELVSTGGVLQGTSLARALIILAGLVLTLVRLLTGMRGKGAIKQYDVLFREHIRDAFCEPDRQKEKKELLSAIDLWQKDQNRDAIKKLMALRDACRKPNDHVAVLLFMGLVFSDGGATEPAIDCYFELLKYDDSRSTAWSNLGLLLKETGKHRDAVNCYLNAVKYDPNNASAWNNLALAYLQVGEWEASIAPARKALDIKFNMYQAENTLAIAYFALGDRAMSQKYYDLAVMHGSNKQGLDHILDALSHGQFPFDTGEDDTMAVLARANMTYRRATATPMATVCLYPTDTDKNKTPNFSRVGGEPVDSPHMIPKDASGNPMHLLAAIWCSEVSGVPDFPDHGVLRFYIADTSTYGADLKNPTGQANFAVLYSEDEQGFMADKKDDNWNASATFPVKTIFNMQFIPEMGHMLSSNMGYESAMDTALKKAGVEKGMAGISAEDRATLKRANAWGGHRIGGYPCFEREDPRQNHPEWQVYDTLLLQIVTHVYVDADGKPVGAPLIEFGHDGGCQFLISREKLRARDFSDVMFWWDDVKP